MKTVRTEWLTLWNAIKALLGDKPLMSAIVGLIGAYLITHDPNLTAQQIANIQNAILVVVGLILGTYKLTDIINAIASLLTAQTAAKALMADNTAAMNRNTTATDLLTKMVASASPSFLVSAQAPQPIDPARTNQNVTTPPPPRAG